MNSAVAYLVRRLDENTAPDNYPAPAASRCARAMRVRGASAQRFRRRSRCVDTSSDEPRARRRTASPSVEIAPAATFANEPDTDFCRAPRHRQAGRCEPSVSSRVAGCFERLLDHRRQALRDRRAGRRLRPVATARRAVSLPPGERCRSGARGRLAGRRALGAAHPAAERGKSCGGSPQLLRRRAPS